MHSNLARLLIGRKVISKGTVLDAYQSVRSLSCICDSDVLASFIVIGAKAIGTTVVFTTIGPEQIHYDVTAEQVERVDGMALDRIAVSHNLTLDGAELPRRARRGRKKKQVSSIIYG